MVVRLVVCAALSVRLAVKPQNDCARFRGHSLSASHHPAAVVHGRRTSKAYFFFAAFFLAFFFAFAMLALQLTG
jgi:hypothetical protein